MLLKKLFLIILVFSCFVFNSVNGVIVSASAYRKLVNNDYHYIFAFGDFHVGDRRVCAALTKKEKDLLDALKNVYKIPNNININQANQVLKSFEKYSNNSLVLYENSGEYEYSDKIEPLLNREKNNIAAVEVSENNENDYSDHIFEILYSNNFLNLPRKSFDFRYVFFPDRLSSPKIEKCILVSELNKIINKLLSVENNKLKKYFEEQLNPYLNKINTLIHDLNFLSKLVNLNILYEIDFYSHYSTKFIFAGTSHTNGIHEGLLKIGYERIIKQESESDFSCCLKFIYNSCLQLTRFKKNTYEFKCINIENFFDQLNTPQIKSKL